MKYKKINQNIIKEISNCLNAVAAMMPSIPIANYLKL